MSLGGRGYGLPAAAGGALLLPLALALVLPAGSTNPPAPAGGVAPSPRDARAQAPDAQASQDSGAIAEPLRGIRRGLSILQIGDSHTAADQFTGAARQFLQERYGAGGAGVLPVGSPHPGVRSTQVKVSASQGWTYASLQRTTSPDGFGLSGYTASTSAAGETLSVTAETPMPYSFVEIEARTGVDAGSISIEADDAPLLSASLAAAEAGPVVLRAEAPGGLAAFRRLVVRTIAAKPVTVSSMTIRRSDGGVEYGAVGYPGATVEILGRIPARTLVDTLRRLAPDIVVLAFGTNEGFNDALDPAAYRDRYAAVIRTIRRAVPRARLVMIGPPQAERVPPPCKPAPDAPACPAAAPAQETASAGSEACPARPPQLGAVREVQRRLAAQEGIAFWDWWALMPAGCGAARWLAADPPLMAKDRIHFTRAGYRVGGQAFATFIEPQVKALLRGDHAVPNH